MDGSEKMIQDLIESDKNGQPSRELIRFIEQIGATIFGVKPACLINVHEKECLALCRKHFTGSGTVLFVIIKATKGKKRLFIYHKKSLDSLLSNAEIRRYLVEWRYPKNGSVQTYVRLLARKLRGEQFPHEIGLFFGYPLKDVRGFMGAPIPYSKTMGWRMYGDTRVSERVYYQFRSARLYVRNVMLQACQ